MNKKTSKVIALLMGVFFSVTLFLMPIAEAGQWGFIGKIVSKDRNKIAKLARDIPGLRSTVSAASLSKKMKIPLHLLESPAVRKMAMVGEDIVAHGRFATKMINNSSVPEHMIRQYSRYGKGRYLNIAKTVEKTMTTSKPNIVSSLSKLKGKYKGMNEVINKFNAGRYDGDIFVRTIRKTGKHGVEVLGWLAKHPRITMASAATAWYVTDPEGFEYALNQSGKKISGFVTESMVNVSSGITEGAAMGFTKSMGNHSMGSVLGGGVAIIVILLAFFVKTFRRILLFPFAFLGIKANAKMDDIEQQSAMAKRTSSTADNTTQISSDHISRQHKPRSNL